MKLDLRTAKNPRQSAACVLNDHVKQPTGTTQEPYFSGISDPASRERCAAYLAAAASMVTMPHETAGPAAYLCASRYVIDRCELLVAVWDGSPATGSGGTADAVAYARERGRSIVVVWPDGAQRS